MGRMSPIGGGVCPTGARQFALLVDGTIIHQDHGRDGRDRRQLDRERRSLSWATAWPMASFLTTRGCPGRCPMEGVPGFVNPRASITWEL